MLLSELTFTIGTKHRALALASSDRCISCVSCEQRLLAERDCVSNGNAVFDTWQSCCTNMYMLHVSESVNVRVELEHNVTAPLVINV